MLLLLLLMLMLVILVMLLWLLLLMLLMLLMLLLIILLMLLMLLLLLLLDLKVIARRQIACWRQGLEVGILHVGRHRKTGGCRQLGRCTAPSASLVWMVWRWVSLGFKDAWIRCGIKKSEAASVAAVVMTVCRRLARRVAGQMARVDHRSSCVPTLRD